MILLDLTQDPGDFVGSYTSGHFLGSYTGL